MTHLQKSTIDFTKSTSADRLQTHDVGLENLAWGSEVDSDKAADRLCHALNVVNLNRVLFDVGAEVRKGVLPGLALADGAAEPHHRVGLV